MKKPWYVPVYPPKPYEAAIALYVVAHEIEQGRSITHKKLQHFMWCIQVEHLADTSTPLFREEFKAWVYPTLQSLCSVWMGHGSLDILPCFIDEQELQSAKKIIEVSGLKFIDECLDYYGPMSEQTLFGFTQNDKAFTNAVEYYKANALQTSSMFSNSKIDKHNEAFENISIDSMLDVILATQVTEVQ